MTINEMTQRYILYTVVVVSVLIPMIIPLNLPFSSDEHVIKYYDYIESLEPGSTVYMELDILPANYNELGFGTIATLKLLFNKGVNLVIGTHAATNVPLSIILFEDPTLSIYDTYGENWVFLGFIPGEEAGIAALNNNLWDLIAEDYFGNELVDLPVANAIGLDKGVKDVDLIILCNNAGPTTYSIVRQWLTPAGSGPSCIFLVTATNFPPSVIYYPDQIQALVKGTLGSANLERFANAPYKAIGDMDTLSSAHLMVILVVISAQVIYLKERADERRSK